MTRPELMARLDEARTAAEAHRSTWAALETRSADVKNRRDSANAEIDALPLCLALIHEIHVIAGKVIAGLLQFQIISVPCVDSFH